MGDGEMARPAGGRLVLGKPMKQLRFDSRSRASGLAGEAQEIHGFRCFANSHKAVRTITRQVLAQLERALVRKRAQQKQLVKFL